MRAGDGLRDGGERAAPPALTLEPALDHRHLVPDVKARGMTLEKLYDKVVREYGKVAKKKKQC